jgi:hypothetical protein
MKLKRFLALSLGLHLAVFALFPWRPRQMSAPPVELWVDLPAAPSVAAPKTTKAAGPARDEPSPFARLKPPRRPDLRPVRPGEVALPTAPVDVWSPYVASEAITGAENPERTGALAWVYRKAQFTIGYPDAFVRHGISGNATARLVFDRTGHLKPELLSVSADSPFLRVYVYRTLESTFTRENVPANLVRWPDTFEVFAYVKFSFAESTTAVSVTSDHPIVGNKLFFARRTFKTSAEKLRWDLGPLHGMFPVPVVGVDMTWFYRKYEDGKHPLRAAAEADDLGVYRKDPLFYD